jgi:MFS family permease
MQAADGTSAARQSKRFLYLYALAVSGGSVAYIPFLTILLPNQATSIWGKDALSVLAQAAFAGAIAASLANILFGWASDRSGARRPWILAGLLLSSGLLPAMQLATNPHILIAMIIAWQIGLNMMLAPLSAWAGDTVPDSQKGLLGGLLSFAPALGALTGTLVTLPGLAGQTDRLLIVAILVIVMVSPAVIAARPVAMPQLADDKVPINTCNDEEHRGRKTVMRMWLARLCVQIAEASLFAFLLLWFRSVAPGFADHDAANIFTAVLGVSVIATLIVGRWSDRADRPIFPLGICAAIAAAGLLMMSAAQSMALAIGGYVIFGLASSIFLALHSSQTLRVLPSPKTRGRDLGLFNLTNTVPSLIMPWLTLALVPTYGFDALFVWLAGLALIAAMLLFTMPRQLDGAAW